MKRLTSILSLGLSAMTAQVACAQSFDNGLPAGWTASGTAGTSGANGVVGLAPTKGSTAYGYVSTAGSTATAGFGLSQETNGSRLDSNTFSAHAGDALDFYFNYVTSDGSKYSDYAYANLLNAVDKSVVAVLFDARTQPTGTIAPGFGLPTPVSTLTPGAVPIVPGAPAWSLLGAGSGACFAAGCGYTGWIQSTYDIAANGTYVLEFGVTNWIDQKFDSGLAFDGVTVAGVPVVAAVPEPGTCALMVAGLVAVSFMSRRRKA